ncbi:hypothetical protein HUG10_06645 [Halorarum halophilum]|uniref:HEWD domain-containing protein n=1 Tax=Halorarum halophilum TaxID=2743090 RepID=A0A7D5KUB1_9EURY|nr:HEWD family protein [Halobaculum halophilum]QLG27240.1 hypothetical protein HUG10_06645 [Halobaculum halophilum]
MPVQIRRPDRRECERCGRIEEWSDEADAWRLADGPGDVYCIHEWDINGTFLPIEGTDE